MKSKTENMTIRHARKKVILAAVAVVIIVVATLLVGVYQNHQKTSTRSRAAASVKQYVDAQGFYTCVHSYDKTNSADDHLSQQKPYICKTQDGTKYELPATFDQSMVLNLDKAPASAKAIIVAMAKKNFNSCMTATPEPGIPEFSVDQASDRLIELGVGCSANGGYTETLKLVGDKWKDFGGRQI